MVSGFFDNIKDHSEIKLRILGKFLTPWSAKLGYLATKGNGIVWYVDGFAGPGTYKDGDKGSPVLGLRRAKHVQIEGRNYQLACFFIEKDQDNWRSLVHVAELYRSDGLKVSIKQGDFSNFIADIDESTKDSPVMLFEDPFGISPLKYDVFKPFLQRQSPLDLILTFHHRAVHRLFKDRPELVTEAIGTDSWREEWNKLTDTRLRTEHVLKVFGENLKNDGGFLDVFDYPIRSSQNAAPKYYLIFASRHYDAFELWNDELVQEETNLSVKEYSSFAQQSSFLPRLDQETTAVSLIEEIIRFVEQKMKTTRKEIIEHFVLSRRWQYHTKDIRKAVKGLIESGRLNRDTKAKPNIDTDILYLKP